jgi:hypothetical protein
MTTRGRGRNDEETTTRGKNDQERDKGTSPIHGEKPQWAPSLAFFVRAVFFISFTAPPSRKTRNRGADFT